MFTGLVEDVGRVARVEPGGDRALRVVIETRLAAEPMGEGASLAVDGTCLTLTEQGEGRVAAVAAAETLARTTLGRLRVGDRVNLERPLRVGDRLGGHLVAGHVDGIGRVSERRPRGAALDLSVSAPASLLRYVVEKGSIAIDGVSLTVNAVDDASFTVSLIPHTRGATTLADRAVGDEVNLEVDLIAKYVERLLGGHAPARSGLSLERLQDSGLA